MFSVRKAGAGPVESLSLLIWEPSEMPAGWAAAPAEAASVEPAVCFFAGAQVVVFSAPAVQAHMTDSPPVEQVDGSLFPVVAVEQTVMAVEAFAAAVRPDG